MPRIAAGTVAEHVQQQEAAVVRAAAALFAARGVEEVSLADIAAEVGLARNSLYRYFPDKGHIFAAWFRSELEPLQATSARIAADAAPPAERLQRWLSLHLDYLVAPEHQAMMRAVTESAALAEVVRSQVASGHEDLYGTLARIVAAQLSESPDTSARHRDVRVVTMLIAGLLRSSADLVIAGADRDTVGAELARVAVACVG